MKSRLATIVLTIALVATSSCATLGRFSPGYDNFEQGLALFNQGRFAAAEPYFERATRQNPDFAEAYFYLGRTYISQASGARRSSRYGRHLGFRRERRNKKLWI